MRMIMDLEVGDDICSRKMDFDMVFLKSLEEMQQSWLLEFVVFKEKKEIDLGCVVCSCKMFFIIIGILFVVGVIVGLLIFIYKFVFCK